MKFDLGRLDPSLMGHLEMLKQFFSQLGSTDYRYNEFTELVNLSMAQYSFDVSYSSDPLDSDKVVCYALLKVACLDSKIEEAFELIEEILLRPDFKDEEHLLKLINIHSAAASKAIVNNPLGFAVSHGLSSRNRAADFSSPLANVIFLFILNFRQSSFAM